MTRHRLSSSRLLITLGAVWVLAACSGSSSREAEGSSAGTAAPADSTLSSETASNDSVSSEEQLSDAFGPGEFMLPDPRLGLTTLSSYRASLTVSFEGTDGGNALQWTSTSVMLRSADPTAAQVTIENTGDLPTADPGYVAEVSGAAYRRDQAGSCTADAAGEQFSLLDVLEPAGELAGVIGAEDLGQKAIGGVDTLGYSFDERAVGQAGVTKIDGEVWVADDIGYVVAYAMTSQGGADLFGDGVEGTISWQYELTDVNQPVTVELPDECAAGLVHAPMLPDAANVANVPGRLNYDTASTLADVLAFYQQAATDTGWVATGDAAVGERGGSVEFSNGDDYISIIVITTDSGSSVNIIIGDQPSDGGGGGGGGGAGQGEATFEMHGGHETSGTWVFVPEFSFFGGGSWTMSFTDPANPMPAGAFLTLALTPGDQNISFSDGATTIIAGADVCAFVIDHQSTDGAAGTVNCTGVRSLGPSAGTIDISISFDVAA